MNITANFTLEELTHSATAARNNINNHQPPYEVVVALTKLCVFVLQPLRDHFGEPIKITSGYRCPFLNEELGGVFNSQHLTGQAADIYLGGDTDKEAKYFFYIRNNLPFDQLILEGNERTSWIHVSYNSPTLNRNKSWMQLKNTSGQS